MLQNFFSFGFRPFFLSVPLLALLVILLWVSHLTGHPILELPAAAAAWHAHEMLFGLVSAAIAGFILTAITNWTGSKPLNGWPLALLFLAWLSERAALLFIDHLPVWIPAATVLVFNLSLAAFIARQLIRAGNKRNFIFIALLLGLAALDLATVLSIAESWDIPTAQISSLALTVILLMIALVGGRITPAFTRNWLQRRGKTVDMPMATRFDMASIFAILLMFLLELAGLDSLIVGSAALLAAVLQSLRLMRWHGHRTLSDPLMWSLHLGFAWVAAALWLKGLGSLVAAIPEGAWLHAAGIGAAGTMIIAVMSRATLGHTNRPLTAPGGMAAAYILMSLAAIARITADLDSPLPFDLLINASGLCWIGAFGIFLFHYGPMLLLRSPARG